MLGVCIHLFVAVGLACFPLAGAQVRSWHSLRGTDYLIERTYVESYKDAKQECTLNGAIPAVVNSSSVHRFILSNIGSLPGLPFAFYMGLKRAGVNDSFIWEDGMEVSVGSTHWSIGEPSAVQGHNCVIMGTEFRYDASYSWRAVPCENTFARILCERPSAIPKENPEPRVVLYTATTTAVFVVIVQVIIRLFLKIFVKRATDVVKQQVGLVGADIENLRSLLLNPTIALQTKKDKGENKGTVTPRPSEKAENNNNTLPKTETKPSTVEITIVDEKADKNSSPQLKKCNSITVADVHHESLLNVGFLKPASKLASMASSVSSIHQKFISTLENTDVKNVILARMVQEKERLLKEHMQYVQPGILKDNVHGGQARENRPSAEEIPMEVLIDQNISDSSTETSLSDTSSEATSKGETRYKGERKSELRRLQSKMENKARNISARRKTV